LPLPEVPQTSTSPAANCQTSKKTTTTTHTHTQRSDKEWKRERESERQEEIERTDRSTDRTQTCVAQGSLDGFRLVAVERRVVQMQLRKHTHAHVRHAHPHVRHECYARKRSHPR
jgi:hypothetical protein